MNRITAGSHSTIKRKKILKLAKGFSFDRRRKYKHTAETVKRALMYAFVGRRLLKRDMRKLWVVRIAAAARTLETSYSKFMGSLKKNNVVLNRKMLAEIAATDFEGFKAIKKILK